MSGYQLWWQLFAQLSIKIIPVIIINYKYYTYLTSRKLLGCLCTVINLIQERSHFNWENSYSGNMRHVFRHFSSLKLHVPTVLHSLVDHALHLEQTYSSQHILQTLHAATVQQYYQPRILIQIIKCLKSNACQQLYKNIIQN